MRISERVQGFTESVIREMTRVVDQYGGVNLAQGMPTFRPPQVLVEAAHRALDGDFHQYAITWGAPRLRWAIADRYRTFDGMQVDPDRHVTVCCGSTETMLSTFKEVGVATVPGPPSTPTPSWGGPRSASASPRRTTC
ncbi:MAG TPA: aminotransferase class I/II-fold pyridoxal phosphate-dependent enzyme [Methylomirabilota bacterium]